MCLVSCDACVYAMRSADVPVDVLRNVRWSMIWVFRGIVYCVIVYYCATIVCFRVVCVVIGHQRGRCHDHGEATWKKRTGKNPRGAK